MEREKIERDKGLKGVCEWNERDVKRKVERKRVRGRERERDSEIFRERGKFMKERVRVQRKKRERETSNC